MAKDDPAAAKLEHIQRLWTELGRVPKESPDYEKLMDEILRLSVEYRAIVGAAKVDPEK
jgi:hypothetical protein